MPLINTNTTNISDIPIMTPSNSEHSTGNSEVRPSVKRVVKHDQMGEFLVWPATPKRKGK